MQTRVAALGLVLVALSAGTQASPFSATYSSLRRDDEGILVGYEVTLERISDGAYRAHIRCAYGKAGKKVSLPARVAGSKLEIAPTQADSSLCPDGPFIGTIDSSQIVGRFQDPAQLPSNWITEKLKRAPYKK